LATYFRQRGIPVDCTGVDIVDDFGVCCQKASGHTLCKLVDALPNTYEYIFISGAFNNLIEDNRKFYRETIQQLFPKVCQGLPSTLWALC